MKFRKYKEGDEKQINELLALVFDTWEGREYWQWKYKKNPAGFSSSLTWIAEDRNKIVGYFAVIPVKIRVGEDVVLGAQSVDAAVHPDYQRQGIFQALIKESMMETLREGVLVIYAHAGRVSYLGFMKLGWKDFFSIPKQYKILDLKKVIKASIWRNSTSETVSQGVFITIGAFKRALQRKNLSSKEIFVLDLLKQTLLLAAGMVFKPFFFFYPDPLPKIRGSKISEKHSFDHRIDRFWKKLPKDFEITVEKDKRYLDWRYVQNPGADYTIFFAEKEDEVDGYIVLKCEEDEGLIMDLFGNNDEVLFGLIGKAIEFFRKRGMLIIQCWMRENLQYNRVLRKSGFFSYQWIVPLVSCLKSLQGVLDSAVLYVTVPYGDKIKVDFLNKKKWFIAMGDSDWF